MQPQASTTILGIDFSVAASLFSTYNNCKDENCVAVQQGTISKCFLLAFFPCTKCCIFHKKKKKWLFINKNKWKKYIVKSYLQHSAIVRTTDRNGCGRCAWSTTKICIISGRMKNPIVPTDFSEINVQFFATTFVHTGRTVYVAPLPFQFTIRIRVYDDKRTIIIVQR